MSYELLELAYETLYALSWTLISTRLGHAVKKINDAGLQGVLGTYDDKSVSLNVLLEDMRSMPQLVGGNADVGPNCVLRQVVVVEPEFRRQQPLDRWPNAVDDRTQIPRLVLSRPLQLFQGCLNSSALSVAQYHDEPCPESLRGKFDAADLRRSHDVAGNADDEQVAEALAKDDLYGHPGVGTAEYHGKRFLANGRFPSVFLIHEGVGVPVVRYEPTVPRSQAFECLWR